MNDFPILRDLGVVIVAAALMLFATRPLKVPPILAYIAAGLLLGPVAGLLAVSESIHLFSELGIALLLFVVGLEMSLAALRHVGRPAVLGGLLQVVGTCVLGGLLALAFGFPPTAALLLGLIVTFSSTVVVIKLLDRTGDLQATHGRISIGILLVQDVVVAVVLTLVSGLGGAEADGLGSIARGLRDAFFGIAVLAGAAAVAVRWVLPPVVEWLKESAEAVFIGALAWAFGFIVAAEMLHVSIELGAFIAGVALAQLPYNEELRRRVHPLVDFFLAVFFVTLGASMDLEAAGGYVGVGLALSAFVLLGKPLIIAFLLARLGHSSRTAFLSGLTLGQISEFGFILAGLAVGVGLLEEVVLSLVGLVGLVTIGVSAVLVPRGRRLHASLERRGWLRFLRARGELEPVPHVRRGHVVIVGMNTLGRILVERFTKAGERVLALDTDPEKLGDLPPQVEILFGSVDHPGVFEEADIPGARLVVSTLQIEDVNSLLAYRCARLGVPVSVHAFDPSLAHELLEIGADHLMISKHDGIRQMAEQLRALGVIA